MVKAKVGESARRVCWGRPAPTHAMVRALWGVFADIAIVHNGQITNYWKMRRRLEQRGFEFRTDNDSELIANAGKTASRIVVTTNVSSQSRPAPMAALRQVSQ